MIIPAEAVKSVAITPATATVALAQNQQLVAQALDGDGKHLKGRRIVWESADESIASVSPNGLVTALGFGSVIVRAISEGIIGTSSITVPRPVAFVSVSPSTRVLRLTETVQLNVSAFAANGQQITGRPASWVSTNTSVAVVSTSGLVTPVGAGAAVIRVTIEGISATATISVLAAVASVSVTPATASLVAGGTQALTATVRDQSGNTLVGRVVTWTSSNTSVATVSTAGLVTANAAGTATITATSEGRSGTATITVSATVSCSTTNPPVENQILCTNVTYSLPNTSTDSQRSYRLSRLSTVNFNVILSGGLGDADLDVYNPSGSLVCRRFLPGNNETCNLSGAVGMWTIVVKAFESFSDVSLRIP